MEVSCELRNPNALSATVHDIKFASHMGKHLVGRGAVTGPVSVPARGLFTLTVPVRVAYSQLPPDFPTRAAEGTVKLRTHARFTAKTSLGTYRMEVTSTDTARVAKALKVAIQGPFQGASVKIRSIKPVAADLRQMKLRFTLAVRNMFAFPVRIVRGSYEVFVDGEHFGRGELEHPVELGPRATDTFEADVMTTHVAVGSAIASMLGADPRFRLEGTLWIDPIAGVSRLPVKVEADGSIFDPGAAP
jgi:LEA14-like dessication related protein